MKKKYTQEQIASHRKSHKKYRSTPAFKSYIADFNLKKRYGITIEEYGIMLKGQENCCAICLGSAPGLKNTRFSVDHDHKTGEIRGLLCHRCNTILGSVKDDFNILISAAHYLARKR